LLESSLDEVPGSSPLKLKIFLILYETAYTKVNAIMIIAVKIISCISYLLLQ
jgi:hypothetical protein